MNSGSFLADAVAIDAAIVVSAEQFMAEEMAELGNVATGGRIGSQYQHFGAGSNFAELFVQHHDRFRAEQAAGVESDYIVC